MTNSQTAKNKGGRPSRAATALLSKTILAAAEEAFLANGFSSTSVEAIAAAAGTSKQTIYTRFGSKESLFVAVSDSILNTKFPEMVLREQGIRHKLLAAGQQILDAMLDPRMVRLATIIIAEAQRFPDLARAVDDDSTFPGRSLVTQALASAMQDGEIRHADPRSLMLMFQDMVLSTPLRAASLGHEQSTASLDDWLSMAVDLFLDGVAPRDIPRN